MPLKELFTRLGYDELLKQERPLLGENYVLDPASLSSTKDFKAVHESVFLRENPLALVRQIHLQNASKPHTSLNVTLAVCWNGFHDALALLFRCAGSFERAVPLESVVSTMVAHEFGDFGVAWPWSGKGDPDILAFVRNNALVGIRAHDGAQTPVLLGREVDTALRTRKTTDRYSDTAHELFTELKKRQGEIPRVPSTGKLPLGTLSEGAFKFFFLSASGSVNREAGRAQSWYYRAGTQKGRQEITLYWSDAGILPKRDRLNLDVI